VSLHPEIAAVLAGESDGCIITGDCLEIMADMPDGCVDAVVTDPPYGIGITRSPRISVSRGMGGGTWDDAPASAAQISEMHRQGTDVIIWGGNYFALPPTRCMLVWDKINDGRDFADVELAWTNLDAVARIFRVRPQNMDGGKVHPTQKPIALMEWCIRKTLGTIVLDPFCGSGTTCVAAKKLGRKYIGIEIDEKYAETARRRVASTPRPLFTEPPVRQPETTLFGGEQ